MDLGEKIQPRLETAIGQRYEVLGPIGRGGMASVYLARHRVHGGFCAVKVLSDQLAQDPRLVKSFLAEARASAALDEHPNIVNIVDIDESDGLYYMIMKYIEGEDLSEYLKRKKKLHWKQAAYIAAETAGALAWSHDRGVIHRDMKPSNIRINRRGGVTVMDFGIAKVGQTPSSFTEMGARAGTPYYMAPEQIRGEGVGHRSDLYGLGVILYLMLTGQLPCTGATSAAVWEAHLYQEPTPPQQIEPGIPDALNHIVLTLLAKDPEKRHDSAGRLVRHLSTLGLEGVGASLDPVDQLDLDRLRTQEIRARPEQPSLSETGPTHQPPQAEEATTPAPPLQAKTPPPAPEPEPEPEPEPIAAPLPAPVAAPPAKETVEAKTLPLPALRPAPRLPDAELYEAEGSGGSWKPWVLAAGAAAVLAIAAFAWLPSDRPAAAPAIVEQPAAEAEGQPVEPEIEPAPEQAEAAAEAPAPAALPPPARPAAPRTGAVYFRTTPPGATIEVDNRTDWSCVTPCWLEALTPGTRTVRARLDGYRMGVQRVDVAAGGRDQLAIEMESVLISAMIASTPPGAQIYIDGEKRPETTNARIALAPGTYRVRVVAADGTEGEQALVVSESQMPFASFVLSTK